MSCTNLVASILVAGNTFHVILTPSRSSFWLMNSDHVDILSAVFLSLFSFLFLRRLRLLYRHAWWALFETSDVTLNTFVKQVTSLRTRLLSRAQPTVSSPWPAGPHAFSFPSVGTSGSSERLGRGRGATPGDEPSARRLQYSTEVVFKALLSTTTLIGRAVTRSQTSLGVRPYI